MTERLHSLCLKRWDSLDPGSLDTNVEQSESLAESFINFTVQRNMAELHVAVFQFSILE